MKYDPLSIYTIVANKYTELTNEYENEHLRSFGPYNQADLRKIIKTGMSYQEVVDKFGKPQSGPKITRDTRYDGCLLIGYLFDTSDVRKFPTSNRPPWFLGGFQIIFRDNKVVTWSPIVVSY